MINSPAGIWLCDTHAIPNAYLFEIWGCPMRVCEAQGCREVTNIKKYRRNKFESFERGLYDPFLVE